jgi:hypothetical protein
MTTQDDKDCTSCKHYRKVDDYPNVMECLVFEEKYDHVESCPFYEEPDPVAESITSGKPWQIQCFNCGHPIKIEGIAIGVMEEEE